MRFQRRGVSRRQVFRIVRRMSTRVTQRKILVDQVTIPDITSADFDNPVTFDLLAATEAEDDTIESTGGTTAGTNVATCRPDAKLVSIKVRTTVRGGSGGAEIYRWVLYKSPDNDVSLGGLQGSSEFHTTNDNPTGREFRKGLLAKGEIQLSASSLMSRVPIFIKRAALLRNANFREDDRLKFQIAKNASGTTGQISMLGALYLRQNA